MKWGRLAGALLLVAATTPSTGLAQDREPALRALAIAGRGARIGATVTDIDVGDARQPKNGVVVETVTPGGPADKAGIKAGDAITEFDGERVRGVVQFSRLVQETTPGHAVVATLSRAGQRVTVNVTPEARSFDDDFSMRLLDVPRAARAPLPPAPPTPPRAVRPAVPPIPNLDFDFPGVLLRPRGRGLGITIESLDDQLADYFGVKEGVLVKSVAADSAAQKAGLKAGDVITAINGTKIYDTSDVSRAVARVDDNGEFTIEVTREKKTQSLKGKLDVSQPRVRARTRTLL